MALNQLKTLLLLSVLTGLMLFFGRLLGGQEGLFIALVFALLMNGVSYFFSDKIVLAMYRAQPVKSGPLVDTVHELARAMHLPKPAVYILPTPTPNAFATGRNPSHAAVAFTQGIMNLLTPDELKGVIAHELAHIKNRDTLITTIAATIAGVISYIANMVQWSFFLGQRDDENAGSMAGALVLSMLTPFIALIIQLAISRTREFGADATAAKTLHSGESLARALEKLELGVAAHPMHMGTEATSSLFIVNPFSMRGLIQLLSTHPPTKERVKKLRSNAWRHS